jgi:shikimate dehydrogenase
MNRYGLIGYPLSHSFSENYFATKFRNEGITDSVYQNFPLEHISMVEKLLAETPDLKGLNITIPYKEKILPYLTESNEIVREIGACNCLKVDRSGLRGFNTDTVGFERSLSTLLQSHHTKALILGHGGAAKAIAYVFEKLGIEFLYVVRRPVATENAILITEMSDSILSSHTVIVNCTPLGMYPNIDECPSINYNALTDKHYLYDLIYNPDKTLFLRNGERQGSTIKNGHEMLVIQAEESWRIWTNS